MTLNETWENQLRMSGWVAENYDGTVSVGRLKRRWLLEHRFTKSLLHNCFFCDYASKDGMFLNCGACPAFGDKKVRGGCENSKSYSWNRKPKAFYAKLVELNKKRLEQAK